ncbi:hypothetical protein EVAR_12327_1 [Eumeta japonica]|uniref:Uncharacterized protein n=1 Tax=Eumeta variegata TaxID=151549 RepID=A0A4C1ZU22_EUMVA|nr:hypothetical protein EVAR_12327_1 [Eumeta japonica]
MYAGVRRIVFVANSVDISSIFHIIYKRYILDAITTRVILQMQVQSRSRFDAGNISSSEPLFLYHVVGCLKDHQIHSVHVHDSSEVAAYTVTCRPVKKSSGGSFHPSLYFVSINPYPSDIPVLPNKLATH